MKTVKVKYDTGGKIKSCDDTSLYFEQENASLKIYADIETDKSVRAYIKAANNNSFVTEALTEAADGYEVTVTEEYMAKGTLYVGFEVFNADGYIERYEPLKIYIDAFVNPGNGSSANVYVVTARIGEVETLEPGEAAYVENVGTSKDLVFNIGIPKGEQGIQGIQGVQGEKGIKGDKGDTGEQGQRGEKGEDGYTPVKGVDYFTDKDISDLGILTHDSVIDSLDDPDARLPLSANQGVVLRTMIDNVIPTVDCSDIEYIDNITTPGIYRILIWVEGDVKETLTLVVGNTSTTYNGVSAIKVTQTIIDNEQHSIKTRAYYKANNGQHLDWWSDWEEFATHSDVSSVENEIAGINNILSEEVAYKADVYTKNETYNKSEVNLRINAVIPTMGWDDMDTIIKDGIYNIVGDEILYDGWLMVSHNENEGVFLQTLCVRDGEGNGTELRGRHGALINNSVRWGSWETYITTGNSHNYGFLKQSDIADYLTGDGETTAALSANQGYVLDRRIRNTYTQAEIDSRIGVFPLVNTEYAPEITIQPNKMTNIATLTGAVNISLADGIEGYDNEWDFAVTQGETEYDIVLPEINWGLGIAPTFSANTSTLCRLYYFGNTLCGEWVSI